MTSPDVLLPHREDWRSNTKSPGPRWPGVQRCCPQSGHQVSLWLPLSGGHAPASRELGVIHRWQQRAGTFCDFLRDTPASRSHPASQVPWSVEKQGHCPSRQEGLRVQGHAQVRDMARSPAPPPMCKTQPLWLFISSSVEWEQQFLPPGPEEVVKSPGSSLWTLHSPVVSLSPQLCSPHVVVRPQLSHIITISHQPLIGHRVFPHPPAPGP